MPKKINKKIIFIILSLMLLLFVILVIFLLLQSKNSSNIFSNIKQPSSTDPKDSSNIFSNKKQPISITKGSEKSKLIKVSSLKIKDSKDVVNVIGLDKYSQDDINYLAKAYSSSKEKVPDLNNNNELKNIALEKSIVLQEAKKLNLIDVPDDIFGANKNWRRYNETYEKAKQVIISLEEQISVSGIFIYFYTGNPMSLSIDEAKNKTYKIMQDLRKDLVDKKITMKQASDIIKGETWLADIDEVYKENSFVDFNNISKARPIQDGIKEKDNNAVWALNKEEISQIILGYDPSLKEKNNNEAFWVIFQVNKKTGTGKPYLQWLEEKKQEYGK